MEEWQQRALDERRELGERCVKLLAFLSKGAPGASAEDRVSLRKQRDAMIDYAAALDERILRFGGGSDDIGKSKQFGW